MRSASLRIGLLLALISGSAALALEPQQDDKSYLPPASLQASPGAAPAQQSQTASIEPRRKSARVMHRRHEPHAYHVPRYPRYAGPRFFFRLF